MELKSINAVLGVTLTLLAGFVLLVTSIVSMCHDKPWKQDMTLAMVFFVASSTIVLHEKIDMIRAERNLKRNDGKGVK